MLNKDQKTSLIVGLTLCLFAALFIVAIKTYDRSPKSIQKVRIDSITVHLRYPNLPFEEWEYHTNLGVFSSNEQLYNVGDSIEVQVIKTNK
jgi:hypothetical protein